MGPEYRLDPCPKEQQQQQQLAVKICLWLTIILPVFLGLVLITN